MRWLSDMRGVALLTALATGLGLVAIALHDLPLLAPPPDVGELACGDDGSWIAADGSPAPILPRVSVDDVAAHLGKPGITVVDARSDDAFVRGHIPGALHLPAWGAEDRLHAESVPIPPDDLVVVYCDDASAELSEYLGTLLQARVGCRQVRVIEGGFSAWLAAGAPVEGELASG